MAPHARHSKGAAILAVAAASTLSWCFAGAGTSGAAPLQTAAAPPSLAWQHVATTAQPPARSGAAVAYDDAAGYLLLFGGTNASGHVLNDTWMFNGSQWRQLQPGQSPPALTGAAMAYDAAMHEVLLFGGSTTAGTPTPQNETWVWNGGAWKQLDPTTSPPARTQATLTNVESGNGSFVLFGGLGQTPPPSPPTTPTTTTGSSSTVAGGTAGNATPAAANGSASSSSAVTATHTASANAVTALGDTWVWDGHNWAQKAVSPSPPARAGAAATWDAARHQVVLVGGSANGSGSAADLRADQWGWNGTGWSPFRLKAAPPARVGATLTSDPTAGGDVLVAGQDARGPSSDTWLFRNGAWTKLTTTRTLPARANAGAAWDGRSSQLVVTGGLGPGATALADTYALGAAPPPAPPSTKPPPTTTVPTTPTTPTTGKATAPTTSTTRPTPSTLVTTPATTPSTSGLPSIVATPTSTAPGRAAQPPLAAAPRNLHPGERVVVSGAGYAPGTQVTITFHSTPVRLGSINTDASGHFSAEVTVPADAAAGAHHFESQGVYHNGHVESFSFPVQVTLPAPGGSTDVRTTVLTLVSIAVPILTWVVMVIGSRRKRRAGAA